MLQQYAIRNGGQADVEQGARPKYQLGEARQQARCKR